MKRLNIDIETYSEADLTKSGVYKYVDKSSGFEVLLFGYSVDGGPVHVVDLASGEKLPAEIIDAIKSPEVMKYAFNAQFERVCLGAYLGEYLPPESWRCTMVAALYLGLPGSLAQVGVVLGVEKQKLSEGKELIKFFSVPCKPTKANEGRTRNLPEHAPDKWQQFIAYNKRDVETEMEIFDRVNMFPVPDFLWQQYAEDQRINDLGVKLDMELVEQAIRCDEESRDRYLARAQTLTGLENPNSPIQLKEWIQSKGTEMESLAKAEVAAVLDEASGEVKEVLELRQLLSKSSVKKYVAMETCICSDGRAHGLLQFYGANRTGRWAGRLIQVQNLPQNHIPDLKVARDLIKGGFFEAVELLYDSIPDTLSQLIRTAFVPKEGCKFIVSDFSAIEARVIAWLAGESWRQEVFKENGDIYCASASQMFGVPVEKHGVNSELRQKGKIAELALGYGGGEGAMKSMGALDMGIPEEELKPIVDSWRQTNPNIVKLWWDIHKCVVKAVRDRQPQEYKCLQFVYEKGILFIKLPSGRRLAYVKPTIYRNEYDRDEVSYMGVDAAKKWGSISSYGPKFVENIIQAMSRDILAESMSRLMAEGFHIVMHVHDEAVIEAPLDAKLDEVCQIMSKAPVWTPGLILNAAGYECEFYQKD
ncbi:MAG: DNA polymerase [Lachnospiraceae bacterium]|nr:DNA polymerase [Lachnospiraceae bacterium]